MLTTATRDVYTVTRLNREARLILEGSFPPLWLEGEISNLARPSSGHLYFCLKDAQSQVRCALFRGRHPMLRIAIENGMQVLLYAQVSLYEGRGEFQLLVEHLEPAGEGALRLAFERLKQRLYTEGLFSDDHKIALPAIPQCIGIITSPTGAATGDILSILRRRFPAIPLIVYPVPVQGAGAAAAIARAIALADRRQECEVLILARGGGSLEDLWAFNEETVARAIYACELPVVTGIGHEIDFTIADLVADRRAATPSAAAELVSPDREQLIARLAVLQRRFAHLSTTRIGRARQALVWLTRRLVHPTRRVRALAQRLDELSLRLGRAWRGGLRDQRNRIGGLRAQLHKHNPLHGLSLRSAQCRHLHRQLGGLMHRCLADRRGRLSNASRALRAVSPLATLERGYAIVTTLPEGTVLRDAAEIRRGDRIAARLARGRLQCTVEEIPDAASGQTD